jgi:hypothetical protein
MINGTGELHLLAEVMWHRSAIANNAYLYTAMGDPGIAVLLYAARTFIVIAFI